MRYNACMDKMKIIGVIAEYNPFHRGHAHHLRRARELSGGDYVVVCMSGSFTQRGEAACLDKWTRAELALRCGADAVFDLPVPFALSTADGFARGGVELLCALGCDCLSFGSETAELALLQRLAALRDAEPPQLQRSLQDKLAEGKSHARARGEAVAEYLGLDPALLNAPNMILAQEYIRANRGRMELVPVPRIGGYHDPALGEFAGASAIRAALARGELEAAQRCVPEACRDALAGVRMHEMDDLLLHRLRSMTEAELAALPGMGEGLERRVARCARTAASRGELLSLLKCKRYTHARLSRLCAHALLGLTAAFLQQHPLPDYVRLLGMRADAQPLLAELKRRSCLPILSDAARLRDNPIFQMECRATDLRALLCDAPDDRRAGQEFSWRFVRV